MSQQPAPLPIATRIVLDDETVSHPDGSVYGGSPAKLFRLNDKAISAFAELREGTVLSEAAAVLGRRLTDVGIMHPRADPLPAQRFYDSVTVIVPVRDRAEELDRCLTLLRSCDGAPGSRALADIMVVDDGSVDPGKVAAVARRHGCTVVHREVNGGPAAARNTGLAEVKTEFVAFCDSDCVPAPGWIDALMNHFLDPLVGAVAPRVQGASATGTDLAGRFAATRSPLDLGKRPARVSPMSRVSYLPTAALIVRSTALVSVSSDVSGAQRFGPAVFDETLRYGEDVDLIWRMVDANWRIRYDPSVVLSHAEPASWVAMLRRRFDYGTSAAALEDRHPGRLAPLILIASPTATVVAVLLARPFLAAVTFATGYLQIRTALSRAGLPATGIGPPLASATRETFFGLGRWMSQFASPVAVLVMLRPGVGPAVIWRRAAISALLTFPAVREYRRIRPNINPAGWVVAVLADDVAYGAGVWRGSLRSRHLRAVLPRFSRRLMSPITTAPVATQGPRRPGLKYP